MVSQYPQDLDTYREWLSNFDYMHSQDITDLFDAAAAIQTEMGLSPAGRSGSVAGRLFANGNLSKAAPGWTRLLWRVDQVADPTGFGRSNILSGTGGFRVKFEHNKFRGQDSVFGEDTPTAFGALQGPLTTGLGAQSRGGVPWRSLLSEMMSRPDVTDGSFAEWVAMDGQGQPIHAGNRVSCRWGYIIWNLIT